VIARTIPNFAELAYPSVTVREKFNCNKLLHDTKITVKIILFTLILISIIFSPSYIPSAFFLSNADRHIPPSNENNGFTSYEGQTIDFLLSQLHPIDTSWF
jgi:hypothetical protein